MISDKNRFSTILDTFMENSNMPNSQAKGRARAAAHQNQVPVDTSTLLARERRKYNELACSNAKLSAEFDMVSIENRKQKSNNEVLKNRLNSAVERSTEAEQVIEEKIDQMGEMKDLFDDHKVMAAQVIEEAHEKTRKWVQYSEALKKKHAKDSEKIQKKFDDEVTTSTELSNTIDRMFKNEELQVKENNFQKMKLDSLKKYSEKLEHQVKSLNSMDIGESRKLMEEVMLAAADHGKVIGDIIGKAKNCGLIDNAFLGSVMNRYKLTAMDMEAKIGNISSIGIRDPGDNINPFQSNPTSTPMIRRGLDNNGDNSDEKMTITVKSEKRRFGEFDEDIDETLVLHAETADEEDEEVAEPLMMPKKTRK